MDGSNPPQPSRVLATPVSEHFGDENNGDTDNDAPPPRRKPSAASNPNPRASATQVKSSVSKPNAIAKSKENPLLCEAGTEARRSRSQTQTIIAAAAALSTSQSSASLPPLSSINPRFTMKVVSKVVRMVRIQKKRITVMSRIAHVEIILLLRSKSHITSLSSHQYPRSRRQQKQKISVLQVRPQKQ